MADPSLIVVCNTSPLTNLAAIGQFGLLQAVCGPLHIAEGVWQELNAPGATRPGRAEVAAAPWIQRHRPTNQDLVTALRVDLDLGEAESIALAVELKANLILLAAKEKGLLPHLRPSLDGLRQMAGFYLHETFYQQILRQVGETR